VGVKEFAANVGMASPNLLRALNPRHNPTQGTLNRLLDPFGLRLKGELEAPPGFEPGVEVLQSKQDSPQLATFAQFLTNPQICLGQRWLEFRPFGWPR
jgi:hypothetical protein